VEYLRRIDRAKKKGDVAESLAKLTTKGYMMAFFGKWRRWQVRAHNQKKRDAIAAALMKTTEKGMVTIYYKKLLDFYALFNAMKKRELAAEVMASNTARGTLVMAYQRLVKNRRVKRDKKKKQEAAHALLKCTDYGLRRVTFGKLLEYRLQKKRNILEDKNAQLKEKIANMRKLVEDSTILSDEELEQRISQTEAEIAELEREIADLDKRIQDLEAQERDLSKQLLKSVRINPNLSLKDQCDQILRSLKARGVLCGVHIKHILEIRETEKVHHKKPALTVNQGVAKVRNVIKEATGESHIDPNSDWPMESGTVKALTDKQMKQALMGIRETTVGWDCVVHRGQDFKEVTVQEEIVNNSGWLMDIVLRDWNSRQPPAEAARPVKKVQLVAPAVIVAQCQTMICIRLLDETGKRTTTNGKCDVSAGPFHKVFPIFGGEAREAVQIDEPGTYKIEANFEGIQAFADVQVINVSSLKINAPTKVSTNTSGDVTIVTLDTAGKPVPCAGPANVLVNGAGVPSIVFAHGDACIPMKYGPIGPCTIEVSFGGQKATHTVQVCEPPRVNALRVNAPDKAAAGLPFDVEVAVLNEAGEGIPDAIGTVVLRSSGVVAKPAPLINGVARLSATLTELGDAEVDAVYKDQDIRKKFTVGVVSTARAASFRPESPKSPKAEKKPASPKAGPKAWTGFEINTETLVVKSVWAGGPASNSGVTIGDKIVKIGGVAINNVSDFRDQMKAQMVIARKVKFTFSRGPKSLELGITPVDVKEKK
jgi:hypothetical protein